jgi:polyhydroxybutyrate depolymerase
VALVHGTRDRIVPYGGGPMARWAQTLFRVGGRTLSAPETAAYFAAQNGIAGPPVTDLLPARSPARTHVERTAYRAIGVPPVTLFTVHGGGHTVPGPRPAPAIVGRTSADFAVVDLVGEMLDAPEADRAQPDVRGPDVDRREIRP